MSIYSEVLNIRYYPVPKVACTSVKRVIYELEHGAPYKGGSIHKAYDTATFSPGTEDRVEGELRIALVRDPIKRFISAYRNRIHGYEEAAHWKLRKQGLPLDMKPFPSPQEFVHNLAAYQARVPSLKHHTLPMVTYLGRDPGFYDHIFDMSDIPALEALLSERAGRDVRLPVTQTGGPGYTAEALGDEGRTILRDYYREDYAFLEKLRA
jgi:hypothetical protein